MPRLTRRAALQLGLGLAGVPLGARAAGVTGTLREAARGADVVFGAAGDVELGGDKSYRDVFVTQTALFTPSNALKFISLRPQAGTFHFEAADKLVDGARGYGLPVHGHTLIWNDWLPAWAKALSAREAARVFDEHIDRVVPYFAGRLVSWDVVNEPFWLGRDKPGTFRPGPWYSAFGPDYIARAFKRTAILDPKARLVLNEAWTERQDPVGLAVRRSLIALIDRLQDQDVRLDAIGLQGHLTPQIPYDDASFVDFLHEIASRDLDIYISEFDIDDESYADDPFTRDEQVAQRTRAFLDAILKVPKVRRVVTWGLSDRYSWWREPSTMAAYGLTRLARPLPYDDMLQRKPMWDAMVEAFHRAPSGRD